MKKLQKLFAPLSVIHQVITLLKRNRQTKHLTLPKKTIISQALSGFTLIELMISVVIVGILAAVAIPMYLDYSTRARASELIAYASSLKPSLLESVMENDYFLQPDNIANPTPLIHKIEFYRPDCYEIWAYVYPTDEFHLSIDAGTKAFVYSGKLDKNSGVTSWKCSQTTGDKQLPAKYFPSSCRESITQNDDAPGCDLISSAEDDALIEEILKSARETREAAKAAKAARKAEREAAKAAKEAEKAAAKAAKEAEKAAAKAAKETSADAGQGSD